MTDHLNEEKEAKYEEEHLLHLSKQIISQSVNAKETIYRLVINVCTFLIPTYLALIKLFMLENRKIADLSILTYLPLAFWLICLICSFYLLLPRRGLVDFKNPHGLIENHSQSIKKDKKYGVVLISVSLFAIILMIYNIIC